MNRPEPVEQELGAGSNSDQEGTRLAVTSIPTPTAPVEGTFLIAPGLEWSQAPADAIESSASVLFYVYRSSVSSEHYRQEISFVQSRGRSLCVVHLEDTALPGSLELSLSHRQVLLRYRLTTSSSLAGKWTSLRLRQPCYNVNSATPFESLIHRPKSVCTSVWTV